MQLEYILGLTQDDENSKIPPRNCPRRNDILRKSCICDMDLAYRTEALYQRNLVLVRPYGSEEGSAYGEGDGTVSGPRLQGRVRWVNHPHRRSDGVMLPDTHGVIMTDDGAAILFTLQGRTVFAQGQGQQLLTVLFETEAEAYRWLNTSVCVLEGMIDGKMSTMHARIYACRNELTQPGGSSV